MTQKLPQVEATKDEVRSFWDEAPCGTRDVVPPPDPNRAFFEELDGRRYALEPEVERFARFAARSGQRVLEIGCGAGADLSRFAQGGADVTGIDLSSASVALTKRRLETLGLAGRALAADAEAMPFEDGEFDFVWSWGVLHHTPDTVQAIREARRVLRPGADACVMLYHRRSVFAAQAWVRYALLRGRPLTGLGAVLSEHVESPGTKGYSVAEARQLFDAAGFVDVEVTPVVTAWDARLSRRLFLPMRVRRLIPSALGWFLVIQARSPARG